MSQTVDELDIKVDVDADGVEKGMKQAENAISKGISSLTSKLSALSAAITAAFSLGMAFKQYTEQADAMGKLADAIDVDISKLHAWSEASARAGGSAEAFQSTIEALSGQLARTALTGTSRAKSVLEGAGIDAGELGRQRDAFGVLMDLAEKAETMSKSEFFWLGRALGLDKGTIMLLQQGRAALKDAIHAQKELGVYTKEDAQVTADFNDRMADLGQVFRSFASIVFRMVLPPLTAFIKTMNNAIAYLRKHEVFVKAFFIGMATVITAMLVPALAQLSKKLWELAMNPVYLKLAALVAVIAGIAMVIEDLVVWANDGESAFAGLWESIFGSPKEARQSWEEIKTAAEEIVNKVIEVWNKLKASTEDVINLIKDAFVGFFSWLGNQFEWLGNKLSGILNGAAAKGSAITAGAGGSMSTEGFQPESNGGIVTRATRALIGEAGAEAVIPLGAGKRGRALDLLGKIAGNFLDVSAAQAMPMGGASNVTNTVDTRVNVGVVNISAQDGSDAASQFMDGIETKAAQWTALANGGIA